MTEINKIGYEEEDNKTSERKMPVITEKLSNFKSKNVNYIIEAESNLLLHVTIGIEDGTEDFPNEEYIINAIVNKNKFPNIESLVAAMEIETENLYNLADTVEGIGLKTLFIRNEEEYLREFTNNYTKFAYTNTRLLQLKKGLRVIRGIPDGTMLESHSNMNVIQEYKPSMIVTETDAVTIKIPTEFVYSDQAIQNSWDYEYLLYPTTNMDVKVFKMNDELLEKILNKIPNPEDKQCVMDFVIPGDLMLQEGFTPNRYEYSRRKLRDASMLCKAYINQIRIKEMYLNNDNDFYSIYQQTRIARTNKRSYQEIVYKSNLSEEPTFPKRFKELLDLEVSEVHKIDMDEWSKFRDKIDNTIEFKPMKNDMDAITKYMEIENNIISEYDTMCEYEVAEKKRELIREEIFLSNLCLVGNLRTMLILIKNTPQCQKYGLLEYKYRLGSDTLRNEVKLSFKYKETMITDTEFNSETKYEGDWFGEWLGENEHLNDPNYLEGLKMNEDTDGCIF